MGVGSCSPWATSPPPQHPAAAADPKFRALRLHEVILLLPLPLSPPPPDHRIQLLRTGVGVWSEGGGGVGEFMPRATPDEQGMLSSSWLRSGRAGSATFQTHAPFLRCAKEPLPQRSESLPTEIPHLLSAATPALGAQWAVPLGQNISLSPSPPPPLPWPPSPSLSGPYSALVGLSWRGAQTMGGSWGVYVAHGVYIAGIRLPFSHSNEMQALK